MKYSQLPVEPFESISFDAGIIVSDFDPAVGTVEREKILFATTGASSFTPNITTSDLFEDVDNAKSGTKQGLMITGCDPHLTTTALTVNDQNIEKVFPNVTVTKATDNGGVTKIVPKDGIVDQNSFFDVWLITNYGGVIKSTDGSKKEGFFAVHMMNCLNVNGFQMQTAKDGKAQYALDFKAFYDTENINTVPYEVYYGAPTTAGGTVG